MRLARLRCATGVRTGYLHSAWKISLPSSELIRGANRSKGEMMKKTLVLFSIFVLVATACAPSHGAGQPASPTPPPSLVPPTLADTFTPPTQESSQPTRPTASETPTPATPLETSTTAPVSFTGAVQIAGGSCCMGGYEGETIQAQVSFSAASSYGAVSQMRVATGCTTGTELEGAAWEPFVDSKIYPVYAAINWTGFYVCVQYQDEQGNLSPVYRDDISVEGMPRPPAVNPTDWYPQIQCISEQEVHPGPNEVVTGTSITFSWPDKNHLPEGVFYKVFAYGASDDFAGVAASGQTAGNSIRLQIDPARAGKIGWYLVLVDANGTLLDHGQCGSFSASLLTVDPPEGLKAVFFQYQP